MSKPLGKQPWYIETVVETSIAGAIFLLRIYARTRVVGFRGWQGDDYLMLIAMGCYISMFYCFHGSATNGFNTLFTDAMTAKMSEATIAKITLGSKQNFSNWLLYTSFLWSLKGCMLVFYLRLTMGLSQRRLVKAAGALCVVTYIACMCTVLFHCKPISKNWQVRPRPTGCIPNYPNFYVVGLCNFITDGLIVFIPAPLLFMAKISWQRKCLFALFLCSGIFIMIATALRNILGLLNLHRSDGYNMGMGVLIWSTREMLVALLVVNAPAIKPLFNSCCCGIWSAYKSSVSDGENEHGNPNLRSHTKKRFAPGGLGSHDTARTDDTVERLKAGFFERARLKSLGFTDTLFSVRPRYGDDMTMDTVKGDDVITRIGESDEDEGERAGCSSCSVTEEGTSTGAMMLSVDRIDTNYSTIDSDYEDSKTSVEDVDCLRCAEEGTYGGLSARRN